MNPSTELATRCPACRTVFRVVPDQLKVSNGWVRCGRCAEVFNARQALVEPLGEDGAPPPPARTPAVEPVAGSMPAMAAPPASGPGPEEAYRRVAQADDRSNAERMRALREPQGAPDPEMDAVDRADPERRFDPPLAQPGGPAAPLPGRSADRSAPPEAAGGDRFGSAGRAQPEEAADEAAEKADAFGGAAPDHDDGAEPADGRADARLAGAGSTPPLPEAEHDAASEPLPGPAPEGAVVASATDLSDPDATAEAPDEAPSPDPAAEAAAPFTPSFVRRAERAARWRSKPVRAALATGCVVAAAALAAQAAHTWRDTLAARWPATQPWLEQACAALNCRIEAPRSIDALVVESSGLNRADRGDTYRLAVTLRNQQRHPIAPPALELALTDAQGRLVARRVLMPAELGVRPGTAIAPGGDLQLLGQLAWSGPAVAGYTIEVFYP